MLDIAKTTKLVGQCWSDEIVPTLVEYIKIPNKSPAFDPDWAAHGYMDEAVALFERWARSKLPAFPGATLEVVRLPGRTPVILIEIPGEGKDTALLYGHLDKQPEMVGWTEGYGPWIPRLEGDKLYGRGGADDGYAMFGALSALMALKEQGVAHARCIVLIEACEESGSYDLPHYVDHLAQRIGSPSLVVCFDSGCGNYDQLWLTTSLRGMASGTLTVEVLDEGSIRAMPQASFLRASVSCGVSCHALKTRTPGPSARRSSTSRYRPSGWRRPGTPRRRWEMRSIRSSR
jgi:acetylornithine deacetylase/succinyl-diaminopimelate desuccinylase-like protein